MNLTQWRKENISAKLLEYLQQNTDLIYPDQDALNVLFHDKALYLHPKWNAYKGIFHYSYKKIAPPFLLPHSLKRQNHPQSFISWDLLNHGIMLAVCHMQMTTMYI